MPTLCDRFRQMKEQTIQKIIDIVKKNGIIRPLDMDGYNIPKEYLSRMYRQGLLAKAGRGLYLHPDVEPTEKRTLAEIGKKVPLGVVCLISALQYHELTTQIPSLVWLAIDRKARRPNEPRLPIKIVRFSGEALTKGIEEHQIEGVSIKVYNPAKTVADCFKYRNKIGLDVAIEALRDCLQQRKCSNDDLYRYAGICRVWNVMRPYLEAMS